MESTEREAAMAALIAAHGAPLLGHLISRANGDHALAEDIVQETFLRAWNRLDQMTDDHGSVRGWLYRVAHNLLIDRYRAQQNRPHEVAFDAAIVVRQTDPWDTVVSTIVVREALTSLPAGSRRALELTFLEDRTTAQAAAMLGVPVGTVKSRVFYGLRLLRETLDGRRNSAA